MNEDELKAENAELHADYVALADEHTKLRDQNARLKAEVERLRASSFVTAVPVEEYEKLKAEVERLKKFNDEALAHIAKEERKGCEYHDMVQAEVVELCEAITLASEVGIKMADEVTRLKAEVERLRKAGDALALSVGADWAINGPDDGTEPESVKAWNAAKEGKPSV